MGIFEILEELFPDTGLKYFLFSLFYSVTFFFFFFKQNSTLSEKDYKKGSNNTRSLIWDKFFVYVLLG